MKNKACCWILIGIGAFFLLMFIGTGLFLTAALRSGSPAQVVNKNSFLILDLSGLLAEYRSGPQFETLFSTRQATMVEIQRALEKAAADTRIAGIILRPMGITGFAEIRELRGFVENFKKSKKPVYSYLDIATDRDYYLASAADSIFISPSRSGGLSLFGISTFSTYWANTFEKLGLKFHVLHVGDFKGVYENLSRDRMSDSLRLSLQFLLDDMFRTYTEETAADREALSLPEFQREFLHGKKLFINGHDAVAMKLADEAMDWGDLRERLRGSDTKFNSIGVERYLRGSQSAAEGEKEIAVVFASGEISFRNDEGGIFGSEEGIHSDRMVKLLRDLRENNKVAAVVLRVNSPGGSALASEAIAREVLRLKSKKPVVVSMGNVAASGGYYISCLTDRIIAQPNTITGSIGVVSVFPTAEALYKKIGARVEVVEKGKWSAFFRIDRDLNSEQEAVLMDLMGGVYEEFIGHVAEGRKLSVNEVNAVAQGRIWTGTQALERKLVDELGGMDIAVERAKELAKIPSGQNVRIRHYPRPEEWVEYFLRRLQSVTTDFRNVLLTPEQREIRLALAYLNRFFEKRDFVQMIMPLDVPGCAPWFTAQSAGTLR